MEKIRPTSVSVISWIMILLGIGNLYGVYAIYSAIQVKTISLEGKSLAVAVLISLLTGVAFLISGIVMIKGFNWGRFLCLGSYSLMILANVLTFGFSIADPIRIVVFVIFLVFLMQPNAKEFFSNQPSQNIVLNQ